MVDKKKLLQDKDVVEEINRHKWLQSELAGHDIGFNQAADDWVKNHAEAWLSAKPKKKQK